MTPKLGLDPERIARCRSLARSVADGVRRETEPYTTVATERTVLRLLGVDGVDAEEVPIPNRVVAALAVAGHLPQGAAVWVGSALAAGASGVADAAARLSDPVAAASVREHPRWREAIAPLVEAGLGRIRANRAERERRIASHPPDETPLLYAIVATGNIHEDVVQAEAAARAGAQCIAVIRSTAQSLLDHVPYGATSSGFGGTFATQENFRLMRAALDRLEGEIGRYVRLVNYASGLCMPEIAAMGAFERLDFMLNDALYGIIFRDINPLRTLIDQSFSRRINAVAGVVINTGEDNYLTTADAVEQAPAVLASQFINERLAKDAGLEDWQIGLGHAFEIDPTHEDGLLLEIAQAEAAREIFPAAPLKYMPPTKHMT
ncbi:MAG TPA: lysine 5,6-aminomutase subunit alpha, partial [Thermoanaerobaculia bacterium]|nr:lysine 5,6-aminomutase subunit alpha [Thermoanaerobaculia bacterium]